MFFFSQRLWERLLFIGVLGGSGVDGDRVSGGGEWWWCGGSE